MPVISLREYETLRIGAAEDSHPSVSAGQADVLARLKSTLGFDVFKFANRTTLKAQQYVGAVQVGTTTIEVLPKVDGSNPSVRRNLVAMLSVALGLDVKDGDSVAVSTQTHNVLEALIRIYCTKLIFQTHRGLVRRYEPREENLPVLRGRLSVTDQLRANAGHPERMYCRYDEFQDDNALNRILKAAVRLLLRVSQDVANQRQLGELLLVFHDVADCSRRALPWKAVVLDRLSWRYRQVFSLAKLFLRQSPPDVTAGSNEAFSLFFDMNVLFEEYVGRMAQRAFVDRGTLITRQGPQRYAANDEATGTPVFAMKPDVVARQTSGGACVWILDTKWKVLSSEEAREGVAQGDLYQMLAYGTCYECDDVVLLYPHHAELGALPGVRSRLVVNAPNPEGKTKSRRRIRVASIDLCDLAKVPAQLQALFPG